MAQPAGSCAASRRRRPSRSSGPAPVRTGPSMARGLGGAPRTVSVADRTRAGSRRARDIVEAGADGAAPR
jgi:hypothetical protein